jgi:hypothetical protein
LEKQFLTIGNRLDACSDRWIGILIKVRFVAIPETFVMLDLRVRVRGSFAVAMMLALVFSTVDAHAKDIRWLREEPEYKGREQSQRQSEQSRQQRQQMGDQGQARPEQRMSQEERRQLRRDIRDAGREVYPQRR